MGVPSFYRWLARTYPKIVVDALSSKSLQDELNQNDKNEVFIPSIAEPNPNGIEFDNLYLDMNGIIHPCSHFEDDSDAGSEEDMIARIFTYIDRIVSIVRPRKILYMAIDGVAPRAKINQQRSRRFRAAKETKEKEDLEIQLRKQWEQQGLLPLDEDQKRKRKKIWDRNAITPGTPFMHKLSQALHSYIQTRLERGDGWQSLKIIFSDANVPGEGEHKIMHFIRQQRGQPGYNPNFRHVLYGMDADLIMLGLSSHEPYFSIIREEVTDNKSQPKCFICEEEGHDMADCTGEALFEKEKEKQEKQEQKEEEKEEEEKKEEEKGLGVVGERLAPLKEKPFQFLHLNVLREYFANAFHLDHLPFKWNLERIIDDFVALMILVGNDFMCHLPSLEISEGAIERLCDLYLKLLPQLGGYLSDSGDLDLKRLAHLLDEVGKMEDEIFRKRKWKADKFKQKDKRKKDAIAQFKKVYEAKHRNETDRSRSNSISNSNLNSNSNQNANGKGNEKEKDFNRILNEKLKSLDNPIENPRDDVRFGEDGWKDRYYAVKLKIDKNNKEDQVLFKQMLQSYAEGLCWVMRYYYAGVPSWSWFYPFHYAPLASDLAQIDSFKIDFQLSQPFSPVAQLMAVLPSASAHCCPSKVQELMIDPLSSIADFYPEEFPLDLNGKRFLWQAVSLLPWIDETRLLKEHAKLEPYFTPEEQERNKIGSNYLYVSKKHPLALSLDKNEQHENENKFFPINPIKSEGLFGFASFCAAKTASCSYSFILNDPPAIKHRSALLPGLKYPAPLLSTSDLVEANQIAQKAARFKEQRHNGKRARSPERNERHERNDGRNKQTNPRYETFNEPNQRNERYRSEERDRRNERYERYENGRRSPPRFESNHSRNYQSHPYIPPHSFSSSNNFQYQHPPPSSSSSASFHQRPSNHSNPSNRLYPSYPSYPSNPSRSSATFQQHAPIHHSSSSSSSSFPYQSSSHYYPPPHPNAPHFSSSFSAPNRSHQYTNHHRQ